MKTQDFYFGLPQELVAQHPSGKRGEDRLLVLNRKHKSLDHRYMHDICSILETGSVLVFNNSRVRKARIYAQDTRTGAKVEFLLLKEIPHNTNAAADGTVSAWDTWQVMLKKQRRYPAGSSFSFDGNYEGYLLPSEESFRVLQFDKPVDEVWLDKYGHIPLPPYIKRTDVETDAERYQTVYANEPGSIAAPTAGLHWTKELLEDVRNLGIETVFITLRVGAGTFLPVRSENVEDHIMHEESFFISNEEAEKIERAKKEKRKIIACGTTSMRCLESAWHDGGLRRGAGSTSIFIYGDYQFNVADMLFTNFHTPCSTLLMLVSAFAGAFSTGEDGRKLILDTYACAIKKGYKFFSYGDAMLIT